MICLYETLNDKTITLYNSIKLSRLKVVTIVMEENGFLPNDVITPYQFFSNNKNKDINPMFFNQLKVPKYWSIEGNNERAVIKNKNEIKARIIYKRKYKNRIVERVEWLNRLGHTQFIDYYNKNGFKYAQLILDADTQKRVMKQYYNEHGEEFLSVNFITNDVFLSWNDRTHHFNSFVHFMDFFIDVAGFNKESFFFNSLMKPAAVIGNLREQGMDFLFWQDEITPTIIQHMQQSLKNKRRNLKIIVPNKETFQRLLLEIGTNYEDRVIQGGYLYQFLKNNRKSKQVLNLTHSDQVMDIEELVQLQPNLDFHIAAVTTMSNKLLNLDHYSNVYLYPNISRKKCIELLKKCDVYLDINRGSEILDAVRAAFDYQLLILAYEEVMHNKDVTANENVYSAKNGGLLNDVLNEIFNDEEAFNKRLSAQLEKGGAMTRGSFYQIFQK
ncbi:TPA: accessory Sec system glycosylation chaperone GtfB [Staphylococcus pseudintermedius]|nr:accessory Sec system glycosylation chaperone GtfB [Staphylococcus pseudintermedius]HAR6115215.1 accessory Sec system glycosylation chaperone GtfB [Staphylococcus pseudintermedius]